MFLIHISFYIYTKFELSFSISECLEEQVDAADVFGDDLSISSEDDDDKVNQKRSSIKSIGKSLFPPGNILLKIMLFNF